MSLGQIIKQQAANRERLKQEKENLEKIKKTADDIYIAERTRAFLNLMKNKTLECVAAEKELKNLTIPEKLRIFNKGNSYGRSLYEDFTSPNHPGYEAFLEFKKWMDENELTCEIFEDHDGVGVRSWSVLRIKPK